jgi:hypothetical protein
MAYVSDAAAVFVESWRRNGPAPSRIKDRIADLSIEFRRFFQQTQGALTGTGRAKKGRLQSAAALEGA